MSGEEAKTGNDFVRVATCATPTEAHLLKGVLQAAGLTPYVADANTVQANTWMTQALGGVRVLVPASQVSAAQGAIAQFNAGAYELEGEQTSRTAYERQPAPLFSPDRAVLLSFLLTPVFGAAIQMKNASSLTQSSGNISRWFWLSALAVASVLGSAVMHRLSPGPLVIFRASFVLSFITVVWYFAAGQEQSRRILPSYGPRYERRALHVPAIFSAVALLLVGWAMSEFL